MADPKLPGIYAIRNIISGRCYIGSATNIAGRWAVHRCILKRGTHHSSWLQRSWNKHGPDCFVFEVLEFTEDRTRLIEREQFWLESLKGFWEAGGYNICPVAQSRLGRKHTAEAKAKLSAWRKGRKATPEECAKMSASQRKRYLDNADQPKKPVSAETRKKIGLASKGRLTPEIRAKGHAALSKIRKGKKAPVEWIEKMRKTKTGRPWTEAQREAITAAKRLKSEKLRQDKSAARLARIELHGKNGQRGKHHTPETIAKMRAARTLQPSFIPSVETRAKMSAAHKARYARVTFTQLALKL